MSEKLKNLKEIHTGAEEDIFNSINQHDKVMELLNNCLELLQMLDVNIEGLELLTEEIGVFRDNGLDGGMAENICGAINEQYTLINQLLKSFQEILAHQAASFERVHRLEESIAREQEIIQELSNSN